jgi:hypothetical protein
MLTTTTVLREGLDCIEKPTNHQPPNPATSKCQHELSPAIPEPWAHELGQGNMSTSTSTVSCAKLIQDYSA